MVQDLSPTLWSFSDSVAIQWYGLSYLLSFVCVYILFQWLARRQRMGLTSDLIFDFVVACAVGVIIGGRLGYCLFYNPDLFLRFKSELPFWGVFALNEGGMSSHGAMVGVIGACFLFAHRHRISHNYLYDLAAIAGTVVIFFGRVANFINGELIGRPVDPSFPLAVKFPTEILTWPVASPQRLAEVAPVVEALSTGGHDKFLELAGRLPADPKALDLVQQVLEQIILAVQAGNLAVKEALTPLLIPRHPSQLYAALAEGVFLFFFLFVLWFKPRKPGVILASFVSLYAILRIGDEEFRMPDAMLGFDWLGLTRGQWLSAVMLVIGVVMVFMFGRREGLATPGWGRGQHVKIGRR